MSDNLGNRMKENYEDAFRSYLPMRLPTIIRLDGKAFHTLTRNCEKPFDYDFIKHMDKVALHLCEEIHTCRMAYVQSDEISLLLVNYNKLTSQAWFGNNIQKMVSVAAGIASSALSFYLSQAYDGHTYSFYPSFDARVFVLPESEVVNYFVWRQQDWERNSIQMLGQSLYSHKELHGKNCDEIQEMCFQKGQNWNSLPTIAKRGRVIREVPVTTAMSQWAVDTEIPIFTQDRKYIEKFLATEE